MTEITPAWIATRLTEPQRQALLWLPGDGGWRGDDPELAFVTLYAKDADYRHRRQQHAHSRRRGVAPLPLVAVEYLTEEFEGRCAYCQEEATTWDHVIAVIRGGRTEPTNIVPSCIVCNSSKRDRDVWAWLEATGRTPCDAFYERVLREGDLHG